MVHEMVPVFGEKSFLVSFLKIILVGISNGFDIYFTDGDKNIHNLMKYSEIMGISDKVRQYTEVLL